jgi:hypothetical protein
MRTRITSVDAQVLHRAARGLVCAQSNRQGAQRVQEVRAKARAAQRAPEARAKSRAARRVREIIRAKAQPRAPFLPPELVAVPSLILTPHQKPLR